MDNRKSPSLAFWSCVAGTALGLYVAAYGFMRWEGGLPFGTNRGDYHDEYLIEEYTDTATWRELLVPQLETVFRPLYDIERAIRAQN